jgi:dihydroorotate dehydrogenase (fumarate)
MSVDLRTHYLGMELRNPLVVSASPLGARIDTLCLLEEAGAAAAVLPSLFEEQIEHDQMEDYRFYEDPANSFGEALSYFPEVENGPTGPETYLRHIEAAKSALTIPVIASLNGTTRGGWTRYARMMQDAGADALELNVYFVATDPNQTAADVEARYIDLVHAVRTSIAIPLAVKIGPFFSCLPNMAGRLIATGADGLVLFNRFLQPDICLETLTVTPRLVLSTSDELRLPLRWIAILRGMTSKSLASTTGVHTAEDVLKMLLAGADVTMLASALIRHGPAHLGVLLDGVRCWLEEREYRSVEQMKGSLSQVNNPDPAAFERANYIKALTSFLGNAIWGLSDRDGGNGHSAGGDSGAGSGEGKLPIKA